MTFDPTHIFLVAQLEQMVSMGVAGAVMGYIFVGRMSAHLTMAAFVYRTLFIGFVFLGGMMLTRLVGGSPTYEAWIGLMVAFGVYTLGLAIGIVIYDWQVKRALERFLGRPLRGRGYSRGFKPPKQ